ncbi:MULTISPECIES: sigma-54 dependent transcriptional regulator [unclassified Mucilaginibacter]|uniref:sigma-54-dependent transcriptional regulator n=1 Tax=unclassified Mucilaginibacter TaxID=2617802 RepID=UPI002AC9207F|nr:MULTISPECIES: sigma-54 dependent transcriptional regulator [unclassified Mucilaginibacter]MEB0262114.1 sigma-54 dependent transcriptional regulator [Mucilaginibacter sp. 10I4]MEB0279775.1 sigma-54 dependent transcriptional regulator [Mucilaginibacter sp. 10B2]MEB0301273.1 sigma-54 dependent transcriptional regulator [Mucilaginibacter sp. 5C4]WPX24252.1 sigma-54 dependent transcriptional regulator [Mucilaginibacter sp. 5C4]
MEIKKIPSSTVLVIDDEQKLASLIGRILELEGFRVIIAHTGKEGLKKLMLEDIQVVVSDVKLPDINGVDLVKMIKDKKPFVEVINMTAYGTISDAVRAVKNGSFDYLTKGDDNDKIIPLVYKAAEKAHFHIRIFNLEARITGKYSFEHILGRSKAIHEAIGLAKKVAVTDTTVLLLGETGTGKEVFAESIHYESNRRLQPFVAVNCSSFPASLLESELFGYKAGAFTGANKDKKGLFEEADNGTIFLDEVGEMSMELQAKLLRVLESRTFIKVGATQTTKVNVRILAATNRDLKKEAEDGHFRLDLYYRLSVFNINLPSLNERKGDIGLIAKHYLKEFSDKVNKRIDTISDEFLQVLQQHEWRGNVRELKNIIERVVILTDKNTIDVDLLPLEFRTVYFETSALDMESVERQHITKVLNHARGNKTETARLLNIGLTTLYRKLDQYKLS